MILSFLARLGFIGAAFFGVVSCWRFFYTVYGWICLALLFVLCSFLRRFAMADYAGGLLIGAMIFLPDLIFGTNVSLYEMFFLWFLLASPWMLFSDYTGVRLLPLVLLNTAVALYGIQFVLPFFRMEADTFCALAALMNFALSGAREGTLSKTKLFESAVFRIAPVVFSCLFLLAGAVGQLFFDSGILSFGYCLIFTLVVGGFYVFKRFDRRICRLLLFFCTLWISLFLYREGGSFIRRSSFFFVLESLLVCATVVSDRQFELHVKDKNDDR